MSRFVCRESSPGYEITFGDGSTTGQFVDFYVFDTHNGYRVVWHDEGLLPRSNQVPYRFPFLRERMQAVCDALNADPLWQPRDRLCSGCGRSHDEWSRGCKRCLARWSYDRIKANGRRKAAAA
jgi:hypothetical protein